MMKPRLDGRLVSWNDERGFGFIKPVDGSPDLFVHISAFGRIAGKPEIGDIVSFVPSKGKNGRPQAVDVHGPGRTPKQPRGTGIRSFIVVVMFVSAYLVINALYPLPILIAGVYVVASIVTFVMYAIDKSAARSGGWRISEVALLFAGLVGGWPGAILAQLTLRHKTTKESFRAKFWVTVVVNVFALVVVVGLLVLGIDLRLGAALAVD